MFRRSFLKAVVSCLLLPMADLIPLPQLAAEAKRPDLRQYTVCLMHGLKEADYPGYERQIGTFVYDEKSDTLTNASEIEFPSCKSGSAVITGTRILNEAGEQIAFGSITARHFVNRGCKAIFSKANLNVAQAAASGAIL